MHDTCHSILFYLFYSTTVWFTTGDDSSFKGCFSRKTDFFRESGDFAGNRETWEIFSGNMRYFRDIEQRFDIFTWYQTIYMHRDMHPVYALYFMYFETVTRGYRGWQGVIRDYKGWQRVTRGYKVLQGVTRGYRRCRGFTGDYRVWQGVTEVKSGYKGLQGGD